MKSEPPPIACSLEAGEFATRMALIGALNSDALVGHSRDDLRLELTYAPTARAQVRELVRAEQACCAFLSFDTRDTADGVVVVIQAPEAAREAAELIFQSFLSTPAPQGGCGCCAGALS